MVSDSLLAYSIEPVPLPPFTNWPLLRGRVLASSDAQSAFRVGVPLPFVMRERYYIGTSGFVPGLDDDRWRMRIRPLALLANIAIFTLVFGWPIYIRDIRAIIRLLRGRCTSCGYSLQGLTSSRCPECGCERLRWKSARGMHANRNEQ